MEKFLIALLGLLVICVVVAVVRKMRGGPFLPDADARNLKELTERRRREREP